MNKMKLSVMVLALCASSVALFAQTDVETTTQLSSLSMSGTGAGGASIATPVCPPGYICTSTAPSKIPLASPAVLKAYALTLVGKISVQVYGQSVSGTTYKFVDYPYTDADPDRMAYVASAQTLRISAGTNDILTSYVSYDSRDIVLPEPQNPDNQSSTSFSLFWGANQFKLTNVGGVWAVPAEALKIEMKYFGVPFVIPGMVYAYIVTKDENGKQTGYYSFNNEYWTDRGVIFLTEDLTGQNGELVAVIKDGSKIVYDLLSGDLQPTVGVEVSGFHPTIEGIRSVPANTTNIVYKATDEIIRTQYSEVLWSTVTFPAGLKRYPTKVYVIYTTILAEDENAEWFEFNPYIEQVQFRIQAGQAILIRFEYPPNPQPLPYQGGKG